jgi:5-methyltetrahydropteroyltriglutamate--homocysteine methyltransferase
MRFVLANHGSYPRAGDASVVSAVSEQEHAGLDVATSGEAPWAEPLARFLRSLRGIRAGAPRSWLDGQMIFPELVIEAKLRPARTDPQEEYLAARRAASRSQVKPVLLGPYTMARASAVATTAYRDTRALAGDFALHLASAIRALADAGARTIQIDEPFLLRHPEDVRWLREVLEPLQEAAAGAAEISLATYFGDAAPLYAQLNSLPVDLIALDCTNAAVADLIASVGAGKPLALGIVDGRASRVEEDEATISLLERLLHRYPHDVVHLQPSCGLADLSRAVARSKLQLLARVRDRVAPRASSASLAK